jgi:hypothetical protein
VTRTLPLRIDSRQTLQEQFGYAPPYDLNVPSFDPWNRPYIRSRTESQHVTDSVGCLDGGAPWASLPLVDAVRRDYPAFVRTVNAGGFVSERVEFDTLGRAYTLLEIQLADGSLANVLLYSLDGCRTWRTVTLPYGGPRVLYDGRDAGTAALEHFTGFNASPEPPLVAVWRPVADWPGPYAARYALYILQPRFEGDGLVLPAPTLVTRQFLGMCQAAGGASFAATCGGASFITWAEVDRPGALGTPIYAAAFDHATGRVTQRRLIARPRPVNDHHDTPGICLDSRGFLHVVTGAHNAPFLYAKTRAPRDVSAWTRPTKVVDSGYRDATSDADGWGKQTYVALVCLPDDTLVLVFRQARAGDRVFGGRPYQVLCLQRRAPGGPWSAARRLAFSRERSGYAMYHHKLAVDRLGRLYLSASYFRPRDLPPDERAAHRYRLRMVLVSKDGGRAWDFASVGDFAEGVLEPETPGGDTAATAETSAPAAAQPAAGL